MSVNDPTPRHRQAAWLYLAGPAGYRGRWRESAKKAGFVRVPSLETDLMQLALQEVKTSLVQGGMTAEDISDDMEMLSIGIQEEEKKKQEPDEDMLAIEREMLEGEGSWEQMARHAMRVIAKIGSGRLEASSQQVSILKEIVARAEGKVGQKQEGDGEEEMVKVVLLPTIDTKMGPVVDLGEFSEIDPGDAIPGLILRQEDKDG